MSDQTPPPPMPLRPQAESSIKRDWAAVTALIVGVVALVLALIPESTILTLFSLGPIGVIFGIVAMVRTRSAERGGRRMALAGLILSVASIIASILWVVFFSLALSGRFDTPIEEPTGPGRTSAEALPFGAISDYPDGLKLTATEPAAAEIPPELADSGYHLGWATTVTYTNSSDEDLLDFEPNVDAYASATKTADFRLGDQCKTTASDAPFYELGGPDPEPMRPGQTVKVEVTFACQVPAEGPSGTIELVAKRETGVRAVPTVFQDPYQ